MWVKDFTFLSVFKVITPAIREHAAALSSTQSLIQLISLTGFSSLNIFGVISEVTWLEGLQYLASF